MTWRDPKKPANFSHLMGMIGLTSSELVTYLKHRGLKTSDRSVRRWMLLGFVPKSNIRCYAEVIDLWDHMYDYARIDQPLKSGLPQYVHDRHEIIKSQKPSELIAAITRKLQEVADTVKMLDARMEAERPPGRGVTDKQRWASIRIIEKMEQEIAEMAAQTRTKVSGG